MTPAAPPPIPPPPEKLADAPFDHPRADLVLRSSDEVHFHVLKGILSIASTVFVDMFSIRSPPSEHQDQIQVVSVSEDSTALDLALRHIYPMETPEGDKLHYASILAEFTRKYQVEALNKFITSYLTNNIERDPVGVYAIAVTYGYDGVGANAARSCLNLRFTCLKSPYLRCSTTEVELLKYHAACGDAASAFASSNRTWSGPLAINGIFAPQIRDGSDCQSCSSLYARFYISELYRSRNPIARTRRRRNRCHPERPTVCVELPISLSPRSFASTECKSNYNGSFCNGVQ